MSQTDDAKHEDDIQYGSMGVTREELEEKYVVINPTRTQN
jgi:DNA ligase-4